jgi:lysophospholipase L1-like esterase
MYKKTVWLVILILFIVLSIVFISGTVASLNITRSQSSKEDISETNESIDSQGAVDESSKESMQVDIKDTSQDPTSNSELTDNITLKDILEEPRILVLGDSIGYGLGDENNLGIGNGYKKILEERLSKTVVMNNLSVPGAETKELLNQIQGEEAISLIQNSNFIVISIGGNDLNGLIRSDSVAIDIEYTTMSRQYVIDFTTIIQRIKDINADCHISIIGLYNPYGDTIEQTKIQRLLDFNYITQLVILEYTETTYVPTYDLFKYNLATYLAQDKFHPSGLGYSKIVGLLDQITQQK